MGCVGLKPSLLLLQTPSYDEFNIYEYYEQSATMSSQGERAVNTIDVEVYKKTV